MAAPYLERLDGGNPDDESSEFVRICDNYAGNGNYWPREFNTIALAEKFGGWPWELEEAPAVWVKRMHLYRNTQLQAQEDRNSSNAPEPEN